MSALTVNLPEPLHRAITELAHSEGINLDILVAVALSDKLATHESETFFKNRARLVDWDAFYRVLDQAPDVEPELESDRIPPELAARLDEKFGKVR